MGPTIQRAMCPHGETITQEELETLPPHRLAEMRHTAIKAQNQETPEPYWCECCGQRLFPRLDVVQRPIWAHLADPEDAARFCPLMTKRLTYDQLDARLYRGRQEGPLHRRVLDGLELAARADRRVDEVSIKRERYLPASVPAFRGRFPDLFLTAGGRAFVFEVQTAPITVHRLIERGRFYEDASARLVWVTWCFDPQVHRNAWYWDLIAADSHTVFSLDDPLIAQAQDTGAVALRRFRIRQGGHGFDIDVVSLQDLDPYLWATDLKERWIAAAGQDMRPLEVPFMELAARAGVDVPDEDVWDLAQATNALIAIEAGHTVGRKNPSFVGQINSFLSSHPGRKARGITYQALMRFQPTRYEATKSLKDAIAQANAKSSEAGKPTRAWTRADKIGRIRDVLFPNWELRPPANEPLE